MAIARYLERPERDALLAQLRTPRDRLLVILGFNTGLRLSEILSLTWRQLITPSGEVRATVEVHRRHLKGGRGRHRHRLRSREIPLNSTVHAAVAEHQFATAGGGVPRLNDPVFRSRKRWPGRITRWHAHEIIKSAAQRAGLSGKVASHSMRRSFAVSCYRLTQFNLVALQRLLGHAQVTTSAIYVQPAQSELDAIYARLADSSGCAALPGASDRKTPSGSISLA